MGVAGRVVHENEDLVTAAARELAEETGIAEAHLEQVGAVGTPGRDPRGHTVTVVWVGLVPGDCCQLHPSGDSRPLRGSRGRPPELAFDHPALLRVRSITTTTDRRDPRSASNCCRRPFTLSELQALTETSWADGRSKELSSQGCRNWAGWKRRKGAPRRGASTGASCIALCRRAFRRYRNRERELLFDGRAGQSRLPAALPHSTG